MRIESKRQDKNMNISWFLVMNYKQNPDKTLRVRHQSEDAKYFPPQDTTQTHKIEMDIQIMGSNDTDTLFDDS